jgi:hypothetical protein
VIKNIAWFIIWVPFLQGDSVAESVRITLAFMGWCGLFTMRAYVEEKMLSSDPDYVAYGLWIDQHGLFRWVGRLCPWMSYAYRLRLWQQNEAVPVKVL